MNQPNQPSDEQLGLQTALDTLRQQRNLAHDQLVDMQANLVVLDRKLRAEQVRAEDAKKLAKTFLAHAKTLYNLVPASDIPDQITKDLGYETVSQVLSSVEPDA